eukprot:13780733-Alexandrium_andersonii.AAC.1
MRGAASRLKGHKAGLLSSSTSPRPSRGWHRPGWRRSWSGGRFLSAGGGWFGPSSPHAGQSS